MSSFESQILYEDNHIIAVNKLNSQIVHSDKTGDESLEDMVKAYLKRRYDKPGNVYCGLVHRLDRPVSGVVLFAKTEKALVRLNKMIKDRLISKTYWAIVKAEPPVPSGTLSDYLVRNERQNKSYVTKDVNRGDYAELDYELIAKSDYYNLLQIDLKTGRHHQIRVQLAHMGCPIKGDLKYGFGRSNKVSSISLHARRVRFVHPVRKEMLEIVAPVPREPLWQYFEEKVK